jgi:hypothetical protein
MQNKIVCMASAWRPPALAAGRELRRRRTLALNGIELRETAGDVLIDLFQTL